MQKLITPVFRVSFPQVFEPKALADGQPKKYSITMLFDVAKIAKDAEESKRWKAMQEMVVATAKEKWGTKIPQGLKNPFRDGMEKEQYRGYGKGIMFVSASTTTRPGLVDKDLQKIIAPEDFYAGCYARASVNAYGWFYMGKSGVSFGLQNLQKIDDGEPFGGRTRPEDDFDQATGLAEDSPAGDDMAALFGK